MEWQRWDEAICRERAADATADAARKLVLEEAEFDACQLASARNDVIRYPPSLSLTHTHTHTLILELHCYCYSVI